MDSLLTITDNVNGVKKIVLIVENDLVIKWIFWMVLLIVFVVFNYLFFISPTYDLSWFDTESSEQEIRQYALRHFPTRSKFLSGLVRYTIILYSIFTYNNSFVTIS